jgi:hypothetical protein
MRKRLQKIFRYQILINLEEVCKKFASMQYYIHPSGIEGEAAGVKGANINWALENL